MKRNRRLQRAKVSADGTGVVWHAGVGLLRELAGGTGLDQAVGDALIGTSRGVPVHAPGLVFTGLPVAVADGAGAISGIAVLTDRPEPFGPVGAAATLAPGSRLACTAVSHCSRYSATVRGPVGDEPAVLRQETIWTRPRETEEHAQAQS